MNFRMLGLALATTVVSAISAHAAEKCYDDVYVPAEMTCNGNNSKSADFTSGCTEVAAHYEKKEIDCPVGRWVNVIADTRMTQTGTQITQAQACAVYDLKPHNINGKVCASGERPAQQGNGWESINYKFGKKGGGNGNDGGDKLQNVTRTISGNNREDSWTYYYRGTMCYDNKMGSKNNTKQDAVIAVYCQ